MFRFVLGCLKQTVLTVVDFIKVKLGRRERLSEEEQYALDYMTFLKDHRDFFSEPASVPTVHEKQPVHEMFDWID